MKGLIQLGFKGSHRLHNFRFFLRCENVWNFTQIQYVVDILQEHFILQLVIIKEEDTAGYVCTKLPKDSLEIISPVFKARKYCKKKLT